MHKIQYEALEQVLIQNTQLPIEYIGKHLSLGSFYNSLICVQFALGITLHGRAAAAGRAVDVTKATAEVTEVTVR